VYSHRGQSKCDSYTGALGILTKGGSEMQDPYDSYGIRDRSSDRRIREPAGGVVS